MPEVDNNKVMSSLCAKIYEILTAPDEINTGSPKEQDVFYTFATPGVAIDESELNFGDLSTKEEINTSARFAQLVNNIPNPDKAWNLTGLKVWNIYEDAITQVELPKSELSDKEKTMLEKAQNYLVQKTIKKNPFTDEEEKTTGPSDAVRAYETYRQDYISKLRDYNNVRIQANLSTATPEQVQNWNMNGPTLKKLVTSAYQAWEAEGNKGYVEQARGIIGTLTGRGPYAMYSQLRAEYDMNKRSSLKYGDYLGTYCYPEGILDKKYDKSWTTFFYNFEDIKTYEHNSSTSWGVSASGSWGLWHASASAEYGKSEEEFQSDTKGLNLSVKLIQVPLLRPWLNTEIFKSRGWKWSKASGFGDISSGDSPPDLKGIMPIFPTSMILARNLVITMDMTSEHNTRAMKSISTSASGGWGPFSIKGHYSHTDSTATHNYTATDTGLKVPGTQIIGFICEVLPKCPNPDPALPWVS